MAKVRVLNASQAQRLHGVSRVAIGNWIKAGKLASRSGTFYEDDLLKIIESSVGLKKKAATQAKAKPVKKKAPPAKQSAPPSTPNTSPKRKPANRQKTPSRQSTAPDLEDLANDLEQKHSLDVQLASEKLETQRIKNAKDRSELISRDLVRVVLHRLFTIHTNELKPIGQKIAPEIMAFTETEDPAIEALVSGHIDKETHRVLHHIKREFDDFLERTRGENHTEEDDEI